MICHATRDDIPAILRIMLHNDVEPHLALKCDNVCVALRESFDAYLWFLVDGDGYIQIEAVNDDECMFHVAALPGIRGKPMIEAMRTMLCITLASGVKRALAWIETSNRRAAMFARLCGFRSCERRTDWKPDNYDGRGNWYVMEAV